MTLFELIFHLALLQTPHKTDTETFVERTQRMEIVADGIVRAVQVATCDYGEAKDDGCKAIWGGSQKQLAMMILSTAIHETHLAQRIHDNQCDLESGECDSRRVWNKTTKKYDYFQQAFSLWQLKKYADIPSGHWSMIERGRDGTAHAAFHSGRRLISHYNRCGHTMLGASSGYMRGSSCRVTTSAVARQKTYNSLMRADPTRLKERLTERRGGTAKPEDDA